MPSCCALRGSLRIGLDRFYWKDRQAYDEGKLTGLGFWRNVARDAGLKLSDSKIEELNEWDSRMWTRGDPTMLAWQMAIKQRGLLTAIVSNMGDAVHEHMVRELDWLSRFDVLVQTGASLFVIPGTWRDVDFGAMAERALDGASIRPTILSVETGLPEADPASCPPPPGTAPEAARSAGSTTRRGRRPIPRACSTPTRR